VRQYFATKQLPKTGDWRMFLKTGICLTWLATAYILLVFSAASLTSALLTAFALAQGFILVSCNIMHDGAHNSFSKNKKISWLMGCTLDLMGGSQMLWRQKHNVLHHTYTNINALDSDLHTSGLLRLHPEQPWWPWHRWQHVYAFPLYSILTLSWVTYSDFRKFFSGHIGPYRLRQCTVLDVCLFFLTKLFYCGYALILPLFFHPFLHVLIAFVAVHLLLGFTLSIVFQLAHTLESNTFPTPDPHTGTIDNAWAMHEVETTVNFAPHNTLLTWYVGGLNFQIEHHLFSRICHIHYPAISTIVRETCQEFSLPYVCYPTLRSAIAAHYRFLKTMGRRPLPRGAHHDRAPDDRRVGGTPVAGENRGDGSEVNQGLSG
jgi:linoleoyl-CoA desaturase